MGMGMMPPHMMQQQLMQQPAPEAPAMSTNGLVARNVDGKVKVFDATTMEEVVDIVAHQRAKIDREV